MSPYRDPPPDAPQAPPSAEEKRPGLLSARFFEEVERETKARARAKRTSQVARMAAVIVGHLVHLDDPAKAAIHLAREILDEVERTEP